ncbi:uncharacterized protein LOC111387043 [Olea europaea var. sylvestris]|uniref:uncharacterized protein LOC111387043 n=1 Tax=Olea europaea var. sylvestris TaxID=158386 RepID=UPI000C1D0121|nr:uncharacterized protein LOC111387043 [Olea europaea var. sylvestris]
MLEDNSQCPQWILGLLTEKFFNACLIHEDLKKNEKNIFCLDCCEGICAHCSQVHHSHRLLQIRRYVYHDVLRLGDAEKLMDCAYVQSYTTNSAKVVFLNQRPQTRASRGSGNICTTCDRALQDPYFFCSLSCKLQHMLRTVGNISEYIRNCEFLALPEPGFDDGQMTPDSVLEPSGSMLTESGSSSSGVDCRNLTCTATTEVVKKKRSNLSGFRSACRPGCGPDVSETMINRRKGTPHRAPLY